VGTLKQQWQDADLAAEEARPRSSDAAAGQFRRPVAKPKVIALMEARVVTGPAKNLLRFANDSRDHVDLTVVSFIREPRDARHPVTNNEFVLALRDLAVPLEVVTETRRFDLSSATMVQQICNCHNPDIVQTHAVKSHFILSVLRRRPFRWIAFHHGYTNEDLKMRIYNQFDRWSLKRCDAVVTVCREFAKDLAHRGVPQERIFVVPNSATIDRFPSDLRLSQETRQRLSISHDERVVLAIGRLSPEKGHRYLIEAVARSAARTPRLKMRVLLAGTGPCEANLKEQIDRLGLTRCVRMLGYRSDIQPLFSIADVFVLPSLSEGSPNVLLESMAAGVPIVATHVGGVPELVNHNESAILVPPANADALGRSIHELLTEPARAKELARVAFERARLLFSPEKYDRRILDIYAKVLRMSRTEDSRGSFGVV
jgi:glycosyltransferase involved in cell wall biosynthesis